MDFIRSVYDGKTLGRILFNHTVKRECVSLSGKVLDLAGGKKPSYLRFLPKEIELLGTDLNQADLAVDVNKALPFEDGTFDAVLFFNALYIIEDPVFTLCEIRRILKPGGQLFSSSPFVAGEMPEPRDYARYTKERLGFFLESSNFKNYHVDRIGGRFSSATHILNDFFMFNTIRLIVFLVAIGFDFITTKYQTKHPMPILYFISART